MEKEFVPYKLAVKLNVFGFDEPCFGYYDGNHNFKYMFEGKPENFSYRTFPLGHSVGWISAPTYSQAFRWFDYSTEWSGFIVPSKEEGCFEWWIQNYTDPQLSIESEDWYRGREEAELACLEKLIEIVETKSE